MNDLSRAVVTSVSHGYTEEMLKSGLKPEWITDNDARVIYECAIDLLRANQPINSLSILVKSSGRLQDVQEAKILFSMNGSGDVPAKDVVAKVRDSHIRKQATALKVKFDQLLAREPDKISEWLPIMAQRLQSLTLNARAYDPRPSAHTGPIVQPVMYKSVLPTFNKMWEGRAEDGGGYREGWWRVWIGISGKGKTTTGYTIGCDAIKQGKRVSFIAKENPKQVKARVLLGLTHLSMVEINKDEAQEQNPIFDEKNSPVIIRDTDGNIVGEWHKQSTRQFVLDSWKTAIEAYMRIYEWSEFSVDGIRNIISWDDPNNIVIDFIGPEDVSERQDASYGLGRLSAGFQEIAHTTEKALEGFFQMSNAEAAAYQKNRRHIVSGPYGSGAVVHSADEVYQTRKHDLPDRQHYLCTKARTGAPVEEYEMAFDRRRWIYAELPKHVPEL